MPVPTKPALLPRPPPKGESLNEKPLDLNLECGPVVLSPPRKLRRVTVNHVGFEGDAHNNNVRSDGTDKASRGVGESGVSGHIPMSIDLEAMFGYTTAPRPKLNRFAHLLC